MSENMLPKEIRDPLIDILETAIDYQGRPDEALAETPEARRERVRVLLGQQIEAVSARANAGIRAFQEKDPSRRMDKIVGRVREAAEKQDWAAFAGACQDEDYGHLHGIALEAMNSDDLEAAEAMYVLLMALRPTEPQSYVGLLTLLWKKEGAAAAAEYYALLLPLMKSPAFLFFAADCFAAAGRMDEARTALEEALQLVEGETLEDEEDQALVSEIRSFLEELQN